MSRKGRALLAVVAAGLTACGALDPYPTTPRPAETGATPGPRVAICYNTATTSLAEVQKEAQQECPAGTAAQPADTDWLLQYCPLLLPTRATFVCTAKK
jgi:hypothetical protein